MSIRHYTFIAPDSTEHTTNNISQFCQKHNLQRRHIDEVIAGKRQSHRGWSMKKPDQKPVPFTDPDPESANEPGSMTVEQVLEMAEIAADNSPDQEYAQQVRARIEKVRRGEPLQVLVTPDGPVPVD